MQHFKRCAVFKLLALNGALVHFPEIAPLSVSTGMPDPQKKEEEWGRKKNDVSTASKVYCLLVLLHMTKYGKK